MIAIWSIHPPSFVGDTAIFICLVFVSTLFVIVGSDIEFISNIKK